ncbi:MAG: antibiotic biosynthesis monooxygenase [Deltaproteobacteria bacterium]|nr:antibiotic biosynthesis monooxygenase [Deltaproteobacteria bacterium]
MSICIIIRRTLQDKEIAAKLAPLIVELRSRATVQPGYITGQTFSSLDRDGEYLVISTWNRVEDWSIWMNSEQRLAIQNQIEEITNEKTEYRYYEPIIGGITPTFEAVVC